MTDHLPKLSSYNLPWPPDWSAIFGAERPLILEIGFGYGHFLEFLHQRHPDSSIIGLEVNNECLVRMEKAIPRKAMHNVRVVHSRAETALHHLFIPESLTRIYINFPDPWFKTRHARRRLMQRDTLDAMVNRLVPGGKLYLATDIIAYAEMSAKLLADTPGLTNQFDTPWVHAMPDRIVTKYERKAREQGRACYYFAYRRNDSPALDIPVIKELDMPHMVIKTPLSLDDMLQAARLDHYSDGQDTQITFKERFRGTDSLLFEVFIHEPTIEQHIAILLTARLQPGEYTLKLGTVGNPRPTDGIHKAVALLGDAFIRLHPDAEILQNKVKGLGS